MNSLLLPNVLALAFVVSSDIHIMASGSIAGRTTLLAYTGEKPAPTSHPHSLYHMFTLRVHSCAIIRTVIFFVS